MDIKGIFNDFARAFEKKIDNEYNIRLQFEIHDTEKGIWQIDVNRVAIEHINAKIKTFRCMAYPYRGHRRNRHSLRMILICGLINYDRLV